MTPARVGSAGPCALGGFLSRPSTPSILPVLRLVSEGPRPSSPIAAHTSTPRHAPLRARRSPITPTSWSRQQSGAGGSTQSQSRGGARSTGSGGSGSRPKTQSGRGSPLTSMPTVSGCVSSAGASGKARCCKIRSITSCRRMTAIGCNRAWHLGQSRTSSKLDHVEMEPSEAGAVRVRGSVVWKHSRDGHEKPGIRLRW